MKFKNKKKKKNSRSYTLKGTVDHVNKKYAFVEKGIRFRGDMW